METPERDFLRAGYFWMVLGLLSAIPAIGPSWLGTLARLTIVLSAIVHGGEALYSPILAARVGADITLWFRRTMVTGYLALRVLRRAQPQSPAVANLSGAEPDRRRPQRATVNGMGKEIPGMRGVGTGKPNRESRSNHWGRAVFLGCARKGAQPI